MVKVAQLNQTRLGEVCGITVGMPVGRARRVRSNASLTERGVVTQKVITPDGIDLDQVNHELLGDVRESCLTRVGDVVMKLTTPYDCAYVEKGCEGLLVTSVAAILRARPGLGVSMRWMAALLAMPQLKEQLRLASMGSSLQMLKKASLERLIVPLPDAETQRAVAEVHELVSSQKRMCRRVMELSDALLAGTVNEVAFASTSNKTER